MKLYSIEQEIRNAGLSINTVIGVDDKIGNIVIGYMTVGDFFKFSGKTIRNKKVARVINAEGKYIFILNSKYTGSAYTACYD